MSRAPLRPPRAARDARTLLPERLLAKLWQAKAGRTLHTVDGLALRVLYPGRPAPGHGPDFRDALLETGEGVFSGDVELHRRGADWRAHAHDRDPAYRSVVLHVVGDDDGRGPPLPTVTLPSADGTSRHEAPEPGSDHDGPLARLHAMTVSELAEALHQAGLERLAQRTTHAAAHVRRSGPDQALYAAVMEGLGYAENREPFLALANRVTVHALHAAVRVAAPDDHAAVILGRLEAAAGLGPAAGPQPRLAWRASGVRPANHPRRRLRAAAALLARTMGEGLTAALANAAAAGPGALTEALAVREADAYGALIGDGRARELAVSAALPVLAACARLHADDALAGACSTCYEAFPALEGNTLTREARRLLGPGHLRRVRMGACRQQGLLQLYRQALEGHAQGSR